MGAGDYFASHELTLLRLPVHTDEGGEVALGYRGSTKHARAIKIGAD